MNNQKLNNLLKDPRTNWNYILIVVILGILVGGGILGYYYLWIADLEARLAEIEVRLPKVKTPEEVPPEEVPEDETTDWKIYRSEEYGFEVKYPQDWIVDGFREKLLGPPLYEKELNVYSFYFQDGKLAEKREDFYDRRDMFVGFQLLDPSPTENLGDRGCSPQNEGISCVTSYTTISSTKAIVTTFEQAEGEGAGNKERIIEFIRGGKMYSLYTSASGLPWDDPIPVLAKKVFHIDKIASTFKFIE